MMLFFELFSKPLPRQKFGLSELELLQKVNKLSQDQNHRYRLSNKIVMR